jgi:hypothetical protein
MKHQASAISLSFFDNRAFHEQEGKFSRRTTLEFHGYVPAKRTILVL